jgi:hypothetical protein
MTKTPKRPRDVSQLAKMMVDIASGEIEALPETTVKRGVVGGLKGGRARALQMTGEQRAEAARLAATARWRKKT